MSPPSSSPRRWDSAELNNVRSIFLALSLLLPALAFAQAEELENPGSILAVQERPYRLNHELSVGIGVLPLDAFYTGYTAHVAYSFHFTDTFAWQVGRFAYSYDIDTGLKASLLQNFGVLPTQYAQVNWIAGSDLVWSPLYGKWAFLNRSVIHFEGYLLGGLSVLDLTNQASGSLPFKPGVNLGVGLRVFYSRRISFKLELANNIVFTSPSIMNVPTAQISAALNFGGTD
jgi:outer membrane beta-barrel protein